MNAPTARAHHRLAQRMLVLAGAAVAGLGLAACSGAPAAKGPPAPGLSKAMASPLAVVHATHGGHFVVRATGASFSLRGFDYQPLDKVPGQTGRYVNVTFTPSSYDHAKVAAMVRTWQADGYNGCRVFLNPTEIGNPNGAGLSGAYLADVADFVRTAARHGVRTLVTLGSLPTKGGFTPKAQPSFGLYNEDYLEPSFIEAQKRYLRVLVAGLRAKGAPLEDVLWELKGEQDWNLSAAPLSWTSGTVTTADGKTYDMGRAASRAAMERSNLVHWANALTATLHRLVPGSLVGVGVYPPSVKHKTWEVTPGPLFTSATKTDFVDVHVYPNLGPEAVQMASFDAASTRKPVIMGEFGATRKQTVGVATAALVTWQEQSCHLGGVRISGWLLWNWNSSADAQFWDALAGGGKIAHALAPVNRPNPCG